MAHCIGASCRYAAAMAMALLSLACLAGNEKVTGVFVAGGTSGSGYAQVTFTCFGLPTCTGVYSGVAQDDGCTNTFPISGGFIVSGLDLSHPGATFSGTLEFQSDWTSNSPPIGSPPIACTYAIVNRTFALPYNGTWTGSTGTISYTGAGPFNGDPIIVAGAFSAGVSTAPPVFPITVTGTITPTVANVQAQIQFRPQDVGTNAMNLLGPFGVRPEEVLDHLVARRDEERSRLAKPHLWLELRLDKQRLSLAQQAHAESVQH